MQTDWPDLATIKAPWQAGNPACQEPYDQNRKAIPADGCAVCVQLSVLSVLIPESASL